MYKLRGQATSPDAKETLEKLSKLLFAAKEVENKLDEFCTFGTNQGQVLDVNTIKAKLAEAFVFVTRTTELAKVAKVFVSSKAQK